MTNAGHLHEAYQDAIEDCLPAMLERVEWPPGRVAEFRLAALRSLVHWVTANSRWHERRLRHLRSDSLTERDLREVEPMTKDDLMEHFDAIVTDPALNRADCERHLAVETGGGGLLHGRYRVSRSGGTGGNPALAAFTIDEMGADAVAGLRMMHRWNHRTGALPASPRVAVITSPDPVFRAQQVGRMFAGSVVVPITAAPSVLARQLTDAQPDLLITYPSILPRLAALSKDGSLRIRPALIVSGAEPLLPEHQAAVEETWGCALMNGWGSTEVGILGVSGGFEPGLLLADDRAIIEPVTANGEPVAVGQRADKVYVTPLFRRTLPLLRYEVTDQLTVLHETPACGSGFRRAANVGGRLDDVFVYQGGVRADPQLFCDVLSAARGVLEYQVRQTVNGARILLTATGTIESDGLRRAVVASLQRAGLPAPAVELEQVQEIGRSGAAAKLRRFVPLKAG